MDTKAQLLLDRISISISTLCAIHCIGVPLLLVLSPNLVLGMLDDHSFHIFLAWLIIPSSLLAAFLGCAKHKDKRVMSGILLGLTSLIFTALWGHDILGDIGEVVVTIASTIVLATSHLRNYKLCKNSVCNQCSKS